MTRKNIARAVVVSLLLSCAALPAFVAMASRPAPRMALPVEPASPVAARVIELPEVTIVGSAPVRQAAKPHTARRAPVVRVVTLDQGGRPGHRTVVAWGL